MPKFIIEREVPGAGDLRQSDLAEIAQRSNAVLDAMAGRAQWLETFVTNDKFYCVYIADDVETVAEHAREGGFPCNAARPVRAVIDPTTAQRC